VVALAEKRIGQELKRGRAEGSILKANEHRRWKSAGSDGHRHPASIAELGLKKHHNRDFQQTAAVPAEVIHQAVEATNAEGGPVTKAEIRRAGDAEGSVSYLHATCIGPARCWAE
jgi:hypothetical protein